MILRDGKRIDLPEPQEQNMTDLEPSNEALERRVAQLETQNINLNEQLQQALQNLQAATAAANAAATAAATATNCNSNQTINMNVYNNDLYINNSEDKKLWLKANEPKVQYDLSNKNFNTFLAAVREKVGDYVLNQNNNFSVYISNNGQHPQTKSLLDHYGECTMDEVYTQANNIWMPKGVTTVQENQDTLRRNMAFKIIQNMLTPEARKIMHTKSTKFMFGEHGDKTCLFKAIVVKVQPSTTMSVKALKKNLCALNL